MLKEITLPEISDGVDSGTVAEVLVKKGDTIKEEDSVIVVESDKASVEVPSEIAGTVEEVVVSEGDEVATGDLILKLKTNGEEGGEEEASNEKEEDDGQDSEKQEGSSKNGQESEDEEKDSQKTEVEEGKVEVEEKQKTEGKRKDQQKDERQSKKEPKDIPAAPSARRLARELGVDIGTVEGSGPSGRILADDVKAAAEGQQQGEKKDKSKEEDKGVKEPRDKVGRPAQPSLPDFEKWGNVTREPLNGIKKATAKNITQSWQSIPQVTHADKADITELEKQLETFQEKAKKKEVKVTMTAILINVMAMALRKFPRFNASIDVEKNEAIYKNFINIGVAVDTPEGLLVPVIRHADQKTVLDIAAELSALAEKAREKQLDKSEMEGGTFSISNLGGIGGEHFTPIVYHPQVAILGISRTQIAPVWKDGEWEPRSMLPVSLSYDHRLIDGAEAARFLRWTCQVMEDPFSLLLG